MGDPTNRPPKRESFPDDEAPTRPDVYRARCPACPGPDGSPQGFVEHRVEGGAGYRIVQEACSVCWGAKWVTREQLQLWAERQAR